MRKAYATAETWHPFYLGYNEEIKRRIGISLRAHYAKDLQELVSLLRPEGVDYFVFERNRFYPDKLKSARYFKVFQPLLDELTSRHYRDYAYRQLPVRLDQKRYPFVVYRDDRAVIVDVRALERYLADTSSAG
jgi:hypothetical protein